MRKVRNKRRMGVLRAGSLAVLSCALALLAVQPTARAAGNGAARAIVLSADGGAIGGEQVSIESTVSKRSGAASVRRELPAASVRRLHVLATMEMVSRWLQSMAQPVRMDVAGGWVCANETSGFEIVMCPPYRVLAVKRMGMTVERGFAIGHCLLAPPVA